MAERRRRVAASLAGLLACAMLVGLACPSTTRAQSAAHANELYLGADFDGARREATAVVGSGTATRAELVEALRVLVALESMTGTDASLAGAAYSLVLLDPTATPAEGAPETALAAVVAARTQPPPEVSLQREGGHVVAAASRPPSIASELVLSCEDATGPHRASGPRDAATSVDVEAQGDVHCAAELRTASGLVLASSERRSQTAPGGATGGSALDRDLPWILVGVGGAVIVLGVVIGVAVAASGSSSASFDAPVVIGW